MMATGAAQVAEATSEEMGGIGAMLRHERVLAASLIGTAVEFYDFYIYATAASLVFGPLFFPASSPSAQLLAAYGSLALAFFARPLGAAEIGRASCRERVCQYV